MTLQREVQTVKRRIRRLVKYMQETGQKLTEFWQENALVIANTLYMDISSGQNQNQIDYILCSWRWRSCIQSAKTKPGADCGSDHQLLIAKCMLARYNLNQIPYEHAVEVMNGFKGLDLVNSLPEELWTEVHNSYRRWWTKSSWGKRKARRKSGYLKGLYK